jgi:hypothetical protein
VYGRVPSPQLGNEIYDDDDQPRRFYANDSDPVGQSDRIAVSAWIVPTAITCMGGFAVGMLVSMLALGEIPEFVAVAAVFLFLVALSALGRRPLARVAMTQTRLVSGRCGACAHPLAAESSDPGERLTCVECGARWKQWPRTTRTPKEEFAWQSRIRGTRAPLEHLANSALMRPTMERISDRARAILRGVDRLKVRQRQRAVVMGGVLVGAWIVHFFGLISGFGYPPLQFGLTGAVCSIVVLTALSGWVWPHEVRRRLLASSLCPGCGHELASDGTSVFVACGVCARTWPAPEVGNDPIPPDPCPKCGTERAGSLWCKHCEPHRLPKAGTPPPLPGAEHPPCLACAYDASGTRGFCPECGKHAAGLPLDPERVQPSTSAEVATTGTFAFKTPLCARCRRELPGHDRVCPRCGVANGTVYR